eukprot:1766270-Rhodomonas_salina.1
MGHRPQTSSSSPVTSRYLFCSAPICLSSRGYLVFVLWIPSCGLVPGGTSTSLGALGLAGAYLRLVSRVPSARSEIPAPLPQVRPIVNNRKIERIPPPAYDVKSLPFKPLSATEVEAQSPEEQ